MPALESGHEARTRLKEFERLSVELLEAWRGTEVLDTELEQALDAIEGCGLGEPEQRQLELVIENLSTGGDVTTKNMQSALEVVAEAKSNLNEALRLRYRDVSPDDELKELSESIQEEITEREPRADRLNFIASTVRSNPGLFIKEVWRVYASQRANPVEYGTIHKDIDRLEADGRILTLGGPQGRNRYCYPNPQDLDDWSPYYYQPFLVEGTVEEFLTPSYDPIRAPMKDVFLLNSQVRPTLLLTDLEEFDPPDQRPIRCRGQLFPPTEEDLRDQGLVPRSGAIHDVDGILTAEQVATSTDQEEFLYVSN